LRPTEIESKEIQAELSELELKKIQAELREMLTRIGSPCGTCARFQGGQDISRNGITLVSIDCTAFAEKGRIMCQRGGCDKYEEVAPLVH